MSVLTFVACAVSAAAYAPPQGLGSLPLDEASDLTEAGTVRLELAADRDAVYVGEGLRLTFTVEVERAFLEERMVQPFRRELDLPVQVQASWLDELLPATPSTDAAAGPTFALGPDVVRAEAARDAQRGQRVRLWTERTLRTTRAGVLQLGAPTLRFAYAERFREDLLHGRVPEARLDAYVRGNALAVDVRPLPDEGRPPGFGGAVGRFTTRAEVDRRALAAGESLTLTLVVERAPGGGGDLGAFEPPWLALAGFDVRGRLDEREPERRVVRYDLAPTSADVAGIPPVPFAFFGPGPPAGYRVVETAWIPLDVRPAADPAPPPPATRAGPQDEPERAPSPALRVVALVGLAAAALAVGVVRGRRRPRT